VYRRMDRLPDAERYYSEALRLRRRVLGEDNPSTLTTMNNLAFVFYFEAKLDQARKLNDEALERNQRIRGPDHPATLHGSSSPK